MQKMICQHCNTAYDLRCGHWEYIGTGGGKEEIWYCCHICLDKGEPCETFIEIEEDEPA
jgi:hypothetical protein